MADFSSTAITAIEGLIHSAWADCLHIWRVNQGAWYNWRDQIKEATITVPFAVLSVLSEMPADWGAINKAYDLSLAVYYVRSTELTSGEISGGAKKVEDLIYPKVASFRDALIAYATAPSAPAFQLIEDPVTDLGLNPANEYLSVNTDPYWSGEVRFAILAGETYR